MIQLNTKFKSKIIWAFSPDYLNSISYCETQYKLARLLQALAAVAQYSELVALATPKVNTDVLAKMTKGKSVKRPSKNPFIFLILVLEI